MQQLLGVSFVDEGGLSNSDIQYLEDSIQTALPGDLLSFYQHCSPFGLRRNPTATWQNFIDRFRSATGMESPLLPLDISSYGSGMRSIAAVVDGGRYRLAEVNRDMTFVWQNIPLRTYLIQQVMTEFQASSESE